MHYMYKITVLSNNKSYIGQTINPVQRWEDHKYQSKRENPQLIINCAMRKHCFTDGYFDPTKCLFEIIACCTTQEQANSLEELLIIQENTHINNKHGYNVSAGGSTAPKTEEWKQKVSKHHKQYYKEHPELLEVFHEGAAKWRAENPDANRGENNANFGKRPPESSIQALINFNKLTPSRKGVPVSEESKKKMSIAKSGGNHPNFGKNLSEETKRKIGNGNRGKIRTEEMKKRNSATNKGKRRSLKTEFKPGLVPWNKKIEPTQEDLEIYAKYINGKTIKALSIEYNRLWKTIKKSINRVLNNKLSIKRTK